ncbi:hypothetical protein CC1G_07467 [Coprinopsis cinerea okayama7|uniref:Metacaspase n=1 Tax=Coprinopsis cinerea (strain Okayama-7 / 130 / ATCC MYA-4618 / FGSC 9003) TaxID=240176 RepID=A8NB97_COPC7|nr:hypothetical protein CC1G_07467 [Coprinopsis cinerea okayama7\|eukprot:XP_001832096.2 hypothetical protein CC1G_07467 [Coprinopsis cinerea okayama7\
MSTSSPHIQPRLQGTKLKVPQRKKTWPVLAAQLLASNIGKPPQGRRALLIAINYSDTPIHRKYVLGCPQRDAEQMAEFLRGSRIGYKPEEITILSDAPGTPADRLPTYDNIMREISEFVSNDNMEYVVLYSGHSGQQDVEDTAKMTADNASDEPPEEDGMDEFIIPMDAVVGPSFQPEHLDKSKIILDNVLRRHLIKPLPWGSRFLAVMDCCHSATLLVLEYFLGPAPPGGSFDIQIPCDGFCRRKSQPLQSLAVCVSACKDSQTVYEGMAPTLTQTVIAQFEAYPELSPRQLVHAVIANNKYQRKVVKRLERQARRNGDHRVTEFRDMLKERPAPQISSTAPIRMRNPIRWFQPRHPHSFSA